jgi:hypothetical protein
MNTGLIDINDVFEGDKGHEESGKFSYPKTNTFFKDASIGQK